MANLRETIRPSADLRNHYNEISKQCREEKEAVIITVHGKGDTVSLSFDSSLLLNHLINMISATTTTPIKYITAPIKKLFSLSLKLFVLFHYLRYLICTELF